MRTTGDLSATMNSSEAEMVYRDAVQVAQDRYWGPGGQTAANLATLTALQAEWRGRYSIKSQYAGFRKCANAVTTLETPSDFPSTGGGAIVGI